MKILSLCLLAPSSCVSSVTHLAKPKTLDVQHCVNLLHYPKSSADCFLCLRNQQVIDLYDHERTYDGPRPCWQLDVSDCCNAVGRVVSNHPSGLRAVLLHRQPH